MTGCWHDDDNNNGRGGGGVNSDSTGPSVISITPADGALDVATSGNITATFSEVMNPATITTETFTVKEGTTEVPGAVTYAGTVATFNPTNDLTGNMVLTATITTAAKDLANNALTAQKTWSFTTGSAPKVSIMVPDELATGVAINRSITATFSEAMDAATLTATAFTLTTMDGVLVPGTVTYAGNVATFNPTADLDPSKKYTAMVTTDAKDLGCVIN